jgi:hypothetical protein
MLCISQYFQEEYFCNLPGMPDRAGAGGFPPAVDYFELWRSSFPFLDKWLPLPGEDTLIRFIPDSWQNPYPTPLFNDP